MTNIYIFLNKTNNSELSHEKDLRIKTFMRKLLWLTILVFYDKI